MRIFFFPGHSDIEQPNKPVRTHPWILHSETLFFPIPISEIDN